MSTNDKAINKNDSSDLLRLTKLYSPATVKKALKLYAAGMSHYKVAIELDLETEDAKELFQYANTNEKELHELLATLLQDYLSGLVTMAEVLNDKEWVKRNPTEAIHLSTHLLSAQRSFVRPQNYV